MHSDDDSHLPSSAPPDASPDTGILEEAENGPQAEEDEWDAFWKDSDLGSELYTQALEDALRNNGPNST